MQDAISDALSRAYDLIEEDKLDEARALLEPLTTSQADNPDVWWVYAHALSDPTAARAALQTVLRLDPTYPEAADLMSQLDAQYPPAPRPTIKRLSGAMPAPPPPDLPEKGDALEVGADQTPGGGRRNTLIAVISLIVIAGIAAIVAIGMTPKSGGEATVTPETTGAALSATSEISGTSEAGDYSAVSSALSAFNVLTIRIGQTQLGDTLLVSVCTTAGRELRTTLPQVMNIIGHQSVLVKDQVAALGARMTDCTTHHTLSVIAVTMEDALAYAAGTTNDDAYQATWKPQ